MRHASPHLFPTIKQPHFFHFSLSLHLSSPTFKLLFMTSYGSELVLDSSSPWSEVSDHLSSFSILLSLIFKNQRAPLMKKIQGLQVPHEATSQHLVIKSKFMHNPISLISLRALPMWKPSVFIIPTTLFLCSVALSFPIVFQYPTFVARFKSH